jgi:hypothetical protein
VFPEPGDPLELEDVRQLVGADPAVEGLRLDLELAHCLAQVGRHEQQPRGSVAAQQRHVVLAEHAGRDVTHHQADLGRQRRRGPGL